MDVPVKKLFVFSVCVGELPVGGGGGGGGGKCSVVFGRVFSGKILLECNCVIKQFAPTHLTFELTLCIYIAFLYIKFQTDFYLEWHM